MGDIRGENPSAKNLKQGLDQVISSC